MLHFRFPKKFDFKVLCVKHPDTFVPHCTLMSEEGRQFKMKRKRQLKHKNTHQEARQSNNVT